MRYFGVLSASAGLAIAVVFKLAPALDAEDALFLEADVLKVAVVVLVARTVFLETHWVIMIINANYRKGHCSLRGERESEWQ